MVEELAVIEIDVSDIVRDEAQPRKHIPIDVIEERRLQLEGEGQLTPILVFPINGEGKYVLVDGECRWRASLSSSRIQKLRAELYRGDKDDRATLITTQLLRNDSGSRPLTTLEKAVAYKALVDQLSDDDEKGSALKQAADRLGVEYTSFVRCVKAGEVSEGVKDFVFENGIDDSRVINGIARVDQLGTENDLQQLFYEMRVNEEKKTNGEKALSAREIVKDANDSLKSNKDKRGKKEKVKRKLTARKISFKNKAGEISMIVETPRETITLDLEGDTAKIFEGMATREIEPETRKYELEEA